MKNPNSRKYDLEESIWYIYYKFYPEKCDCAHQML